MTTLRLPALVGTRNRARALTRPLPRDLSGKTVVVDGTNMLASTVSFADELIKQIASRHAAHMEVVNVSDDEFEVWIRERAEANNFADRVTVKSKKTLSAASGRRLLPASSKRPAVS